MTDAHELKTGNAAKEAKSAKRKAAWSRWRKYLKPRIVPTVVLLVGVGLVGYVSIRSFAKPPPTATETTLYVMLATVLQIGGATVFGRVGRVDRNHARSAVRRVIAVAENVRRSRQLLGGPGSAKASADEVLGTVERDLENSIGDWNDVYGDALNDVLKERSSPPGSIDD